MKTIDQAVGERIRAERTSAAITEAVFAQALEMSCGRLALCEAGQARFSAIELQCVCDVLKIRPVTIFASVTGQPLRPPSK